MLVSLVFSSSVQNCNSSPSVYDQRVAKLTLPSAPSEIESMLVSLKKGCENCKKAVPTPISWYFLTDTLKVYTSLLYGLVRLRQQNLLVIVRKIWCFGLQHLVPSPQTQLERVQVSCQEHLVLLPLIQLTNLPGTAAPDSKTTHILFHLQCEKKSPPCSSFYVTSMRLFSSLSFFFLFNPPPIPPSIAR